MSATGPIAPEPHRFSIHLPRALWVFLAAVVLVVGAVALPLGFRMYRHQAAVRKFREMEAVSSYYSGGPRWLRSWLSDDWLERFDNQFDEIATMNLSLADMSDNDLAALSGVPSLQSLELDQTPVTDAGLQYVRGLPRLGVLSLTRTSITDVG